MTYQDPYSGSGGGQQQWQQSSWQQQPPRKKKGLKRIIFGSLGIVANIVGVFVMPFVAALILAGISVGTAELTPIDADGGTFRADTTSIYYVAVPEDDVAAATCEITGADVTVDPVAATPTGDIDGITYVDAYSVSASGGQEVTVQCVGTDSVAVSEIGMGGTLIAFGVGVIVPLVLGFIALIMLIWGIIARVRS